jgi:hypothetical protein
MQGYAWLRRVCIGVGAMIALSLLGVASASADSGFGIPAAAISRSLERSLSSSVRRFAVEISERRRPPSAC